MPDFDFSSAKNYGPPEAPRVTLTRRYNDKMDGCDTKTFGRLASTANRRDNGLAISFFAKENQRYAPKVSVPESVIQDARRDGASLIFLYHTESGTVYEFDMDDFTEKPYDEEYGEERFQHPRGIRGAKYRWYAIGDSFFSNDNFWFP